MLPCQSLAHEARTGTVRINRIEGVTTLVRETGWVYIGGERVPRMVQDGFDALRRTMPSRNWLASVHLARIDSHQTPCD